MLNYDPKTGVEQPVDTGDGAGTSNLAGRTPADLTTGADNETDSAALSLSTLALGAGAVP